MQATSRWAALHAVRGCGEQVKTERVLQGCTAADGGEVRGNKNKNYPEKG